MAYVIELMFLLLFSEKELQYMWRQTTKDIIIWVQVPEQTSKSDLNVTVDTDQVKIKCKDSVLLEGSTWHCSEPQLTTWTLDSGK
jgi:HSP20 family molecular chaperone IbpA